MNYLFFCSELRNVDRTNVLSRSLSQPAECGLKTPRRIAALAMVMALSLFVYTLAQRTLRQSLAQQG